MMPTGICIATPAYEGQCAIKYTESLLHLCLALSQRRIGLSYVHTQGSFISAARNNAVHYFLTKTSASHLLFIDADMSWRTADMMRLLNHAELDIIAALCPRKRYDWAAIAKAARDNPTLDPALLPLYGADIIGRPEDPLPDAPIEVDYAGAGIMLIARGVFDRLKTAHPDWVLTEGVSKGGHAYFDGGRDRGGGFLGEDHAFCQEARAVGARIHVCPWLRIGHIGQHEFVGQPTATGVG
jgi:hypothetical protein